MGTTCMKGAAAGWVAITVGILVVTVSWHTHDERPDPALAARIGAPGAARAVGAAVGRNPISFVVPCHRVIGSTGALTGYHWGLTRKRAMLGWEAGQTSAVQDV